MIYIGLMSRIEQTIARVGIERLISLLSTYIEMTRLTAIKAENYFLLNMHDIAVKHESMILPSAFYVFQLLDFFLSLDNARPLATNY